MRRKLRFGRRCCRLGELYLLLSLGLGWGNEEGVSLSAERELRVSDDSGEKDRSWKSRLCDWDFVGRVSRV